MCVPYCLIWRTLVLIVCIHCVSYMYTFMTEIWTNLSKRGVISGDGVVAIPLYKLYILTTYRWHADATKKLNTFSRILFVPFKLYYIGILNTCDMGEKNGLLFMFEFKYVTSALCREPHPHVDWLCWEGQSTQFMLHRQRGNCGVGPVCLCPLSLPAYSVSVWMGCLYSTCESCFQNGILALHCIHSKT